METTTMQESLGALTSEQLVAQMAERELSGMAAAELAARGKAAMEALLGGLAHSDRKVRATCALLLDHVADDRCIEPLLQAMQHDPYEAVRRCAMHALVCDGCKECPLNTDVVGALIGSALTDRSKEVRRRAVFYLSQQRPDARTVLALKALLAVETDAIVRIRAHHTMAGLDDKIGE